MSRTVGVSGLPLTCAVALAIAQISQGAAPATTPATAASSAAATVGSDAVRNGQATRPGSVAPPSQVTTLPQRNDPADEGRIQKTIDDTARGLLRDSGGDPDRFVRLSFPEGIPFKATQEVLDKDDLPRLYAIMKDPTQSEY